MTGNSQSRLTYNFWLPPELWMSVAYFLPRIPDQPRWQPWVKYRALNRIFKKEIEDYYFEHWINGSQIWVFCEDMGRADGPTPVFTYFREVYDFSGFRDSEQRIAVFEGQILNWTDPADRLDLLRMEARLKVFNEIGYHPYIAFKIERGVTDLLPVDLRFRHTITRSYFTFDWRTYLYTLLDELRRLDEYEERFRVLYSQILIQLLFQCSPGQCKSQVQLAIELCWKKRRGEVLSLERMLHLMRAAGTELVRRDGRLREIRRRRRYRLGVKTGQLQPRLTLRPTDVIEDRFVQLDEEHVANTLLIMAMNNSSLCPAVEW
jgi:hypothetical protein